MKIGKLLKEFLESEKSGGLLLICCTIISLVLANSGIGGRYHELWAYKLGGLSIEHWVNDGLMAIFFLLIGLELEREVYAGELSNFKDALFPVIGALGGVLIPAGIYTFFNHGTVTQAGAGIPMATDIAFALGVLSLLGSRVPVSIKIFLTALAVIDDLCAIVVIAVFYSKGIDGLSLGIAMGMFLLLLLLNRLKVKMMLPYLAGGVIMWYFMLRSGVHATIAGVLLAFAIPFGDGGRETASYKLQHFLHRPVAFGILPVFALANTAIYLSGNIGDVLSQNYSLGIALGLIVGKPLGVILFTWLAVAAGLCKLPPGIQWKYMAGVGILAGIGFTMSVFIALLAFDDPAIINNAKLVILLASLISGVIGFIGLKVLLGREKLTDDS